jgi:hypothetical protein
MQRLQGLKDACLSGGADGADLAWGLSAENLGHAVIHWSFVGHPSRAPENLIVRLSEEELKLGDDALRQAAIPIGRKLPLGRPINPLLQRDYYQVAWSEACYAVTFMENNAVSPGGTAWATTMFTQLHPESRRLYVFDQTRGAWFQYNGDTFDQIDSPPRPSGIWAGVGSRNLLPNGREAIRRLMRYPDDK